jgi:hypothetical protein
MLASAQVVDAVAALVASVSGMAGHVHTSRLHPLAEADLPAWRVLADDEPVETKGIHFGALQEHRVTVVCQGYARAVANMDDTLHAMAEAALLKLFETSASAALSPLNCAMSLSRITREVVAEGEAAMGRITLDLHVLFNTRSNAPGIII